MHILALVVATNHIPGQARALSCPMVSFVYSKWAVSVCFSSLVPCPSRPLWTLVDSQIHESCPQTWSLEACALPFLLQVSRPRRARQIIVGFRLVQPNPT